MTESDKIYRIAYTVGDESEHQTKYLGELLTLTEAQDTVTRMNKEEKQAKPKGGLGSSSTPVLSTTYFYEKDPFAVLESLISQAGGKLPKLETFYRSESGKIELHFEDQLQRVRTLQGQYLWDSSVPHPDQETFMLLLDQTFHLEALRERLDGGSHEGRIAACLGPIVTISLKGAAATQDNEEPNPRHLCSRCGMVTRNPGPFCSICQRHLDKNQPQLVELFEECTNCQTTFRFTVTQSQFDRYFPSRQELVQDLFPEIPIPARAVLTQGHVCGLCLPQSDESIKETIKEYIYHED